MVTEGALWDERHYLTPGWALGASIGSRVIGWELARGLALPLQLRAAQHLEVSWSQFLEWLCGIICICSIYLMRIHTAFVHGLRRGMRRGMRCLRYYPILFSILSRTILPAASAPLCNETAPTMANMVEVSTT